MKHPYRIDIPVLLIFFCRDSKFAKVFEQIKTARPSKLYLYQDAPRENHPNDLIGVEKCRMICSDEEIDWECEVHRFYQTENKGCDPSEYIAQKWMFETEEMGIVLEDDDVPAQAFFPFAKELLERYKDDSRIAIICGMNNFDVEQGIDESYFFSKRGSIWGWASWRRFLDLWDGSYKWIGDREIEQKIASYCDGGLDYNSYYKTAITHKATGRAHYESIMFATAAQNNMLNIVPKFNMISNIGVDEVSTHSVADIRLLPRKTQKLFYKKVYEIDFPLTHPRAVERNLFFDLKYKANAVESFFMRIEVLFRRIVFKGLHG